MLVIFAHTSVSMFHTPHPNVQDAIIPGLKCTAVVRTMLASEQMLMLARAILPPPVHHQYVLSKHCHENKITL